MEPSSSAPPSIRCLLSSRLFHLIALLVSLGALAASVGIASGAEGPATEAELPPGGASPQQSWEALQSPAAVPLAPPGADATVADELPHEDLGPAEALELVEGVFPEELESTAGIYGELEPSSFLDDHAAVVPVGSLPGPGANPLGRPAPDLGPGTQTIVESALPLRTENAGGEVEAVDLTLESSEGVLRPGNPLTEVGLPTELDEGISLPGVGVTIELPGSEGEGQVSGPEGSFAFYPNTAEDTDLLAAPVPTGVETMTDIRSPSAPQSQSYRLSMPAGASLRAEEGGAQVVEGDRTLVTIPPPTATDASGATVPVSMAVTGDELEVTVAAEPGTAYPILVDPAFLNEEWAWYPTTKSTLDGWSPYETVVNGSYRALPYAFFWGPNYRGLDMTSGFEGGAPSGTNATWLHTVPRYYEEVTPGRPAPTSWIHSFYVEGVYFQTHNDHSAYPVLITGLVSPGSGWTYLRTRYGTEGDMGSLTNYYLIPNEAESKGVKIAQMSLATFQDEYPRPKLRDAYFANAVTVIADDDAPAILKLTGPTQWVDSTAPPLGYTFEDTGLGVFAALVAPTGNPVAVKTTFGCSGGSTSPCPRAASSTESGRPALTFDPSAMPTGNDQVTVTVADPTYATGHLVSKTVPVDVDHTAPQVTLTGAQSGTSYSLTVETKDGGSSAPQSGVKEVKVYLDGALKETKTNTCPTTGCPYSLNFTYGQDLGALADGEHALEVIAVDQVGHQHAETQPFTVQPPPDTTITFGPEGLTNLTRPVLSYESTELESRFECKLDSGSFEPCNLAETELLEEQPESELSEGSHTFAVRAVNQFEEVDPTPATRTISVDVEGPTVEVTSGPEGATGEAQPTFLFSAAGGAVSCYLESESTAEPTEEGEPPFEPCTTSTSFTLSESLPDGSYVVGVHAEDAAENEAEDIRFFTVDTSIPDTAITSAPPTPTDDAAPTIGFSSSEPDVTFRCRFDGEVFHVCSGPGASDTPPTALAAGAHSFEVRAEDAAGNVDQTPATANFTLITDGPQTSIDSGPEGAIAVTEAAFHYSTDETASFECRLDGGSFGSCPAVGKTYIGLAEGEHVFEVRGKNTAAVDDPTPARRAFTIDTSSPSTPTLRGSLLEEEGYGPYLEVEASDGSNSSAGARRSGVRTVQILLAAEVIRELKAECEADVCPPDFSRRVQLPYQALLAAPEGADIEVKAFDGKGHSSSTTAEIKEPHDNVVEASEPEEAGTFRAQAEAVSSSDPECKEQLTPLEPGRYKGSVAHGTEHADLIVWHRKIKTMIGGGGCDVIIGGQGPTTIRGGPDDDIIRGGGSDDKLRGEGGADRIFGGIGDDKLYGSAGNDVLDGGPGADLEKGEGDNDTLRGGQGADRLLGEGGDNTASFADALPPGYIEEDNDELLESEQKPTIRKKAEGKGVPKPFPEADSGVYVDMAKHKVYAGKLGEGGGIDKIKGIQHVVGSAFSDLIEGAGLSSIDPGPGRDAVIAPGVDVDKEPGDYVNGEVVAGATPTNKQKLEIGEYDAGGEVNVYVIGSNQGDNLTIDPSGSAVRITGGRLPDKAPGCNSTKTGFSCPDNKQLGALVIYGGQRNDTLKMANENPNLPGGIELDGGPGIDTLRGGEEEELLVDGIQAGSKSPEELMGNGGEDALAQGEGADKVSGGLGSDLFLNSRICEGDTIYADAAGHPAGSTESDNAQFHALPNLGVWIDMEKGKLGGKGKNNGKTFKNNCANEGLRTFAGFNNFEGSPKGDVVLGNANHNLIIGRGGENRLFGRGGVDKINAKNKHPELKVDCGGQRGDHVQEDKYDVQYKVVVPGSCKKIGGGHEYPDTKDPPGPLRKGRKVPSGGGGAKASSLVAGPFRGEAFLSEGGGSEEESLADPTAEFHLDEMSGTGAANESAEEEGSDGTYMAKGTGPSVNGPGPALGAESALLGGEGDEGEEEGSSISLNGSAAYVDLGGQAGPLPGAESYSLSLYVKFANAPGQREYIFSSSKESGEGAYIYRAADGSIVFATSQRAGAPTIASAPVTTGEWHLVVASLVGQTISLNIDGFPYELGYGSTVIPNPVAAPESLLGAGPGATDLLAGWLDELVAYEGVLSEGEIIDLAVNSKAQLAEYLPMAAPETADQDEDGVPDGADNCPATANPEQTDVNEDGIGDACQTLDQDGDEVADDPDNCPTIYNPDQTDTNSDGLGDACSQMPPTAATGEANGITATGATLNGALNPGSETTTYRFEYGTTVAYGSVIPEGAGKAAGSGTAPVAASQVVAGLKPGTTYHFRIVAENEGGVSEGEDETFETAPMSTAEALSALPTNEVFDGSAASLERFKKWSTLGWSEGSAEARKGSDTTTGWRPVEGFPKPDWLLLPGLDQRPRFRDHGDRHPERGRGDHRTLFLDLAGDAETRCDAAGRVRT